MERKGRKHVGQGQPFLKELGKGGKRKQKGMNRKQKHGNECMLRRRRACRLTTRVDGLALGENQWLIINSTPKSKNNGARKMNECQNRVILA